MTFLLAVVLLLSLPAPAAAQFVCGGHFVTGSAVRMAADADRSALLSQPGWFTVRDRELWDQLVYNAHDNHSTNAGPLDRRRTMVVAAGTVPTITVCMESADQSYTGERLAPFANESWWREHIGRWTGMPWRGELQIGRECSSALWRKIEVREARPEDDLDDTTLARADTNRFLGRWLRTEILWNPDSLRRVDEFQAGWGLAHELGHALGMWHVETGTGFVMEARNPRAPRPMPAKERELAQLAYEVGPGVRYPGLEDATPVPALPFLDGLFRWLMR